MKKILKESLGFTFITLVLISGFSLCVFLFFKEGFFAQEALLQSNRKANSAGSIFFHNVIFDGVFAIPFINKAYFIFSFFMISIDISIHMIAKGVLVTFLNLFHLPIEVFSFALILTLSKRYRKKEMDFSKRLAFQTVALSVFLLLISAFIEFY